MTVNNKRILLISIASILILSGVIIPSFYYPQPEFKQIGDSIGSSPKDNPDAISGIKDYIKSPSNMQINFRYDSQIPYDNSGNSDLDFWINTRLENNYSPILPKYRSIFMSVSYASLLNTSNYEKNGDIWQLVSNSSIWGDLNRTLLYPGEHNEGFTLLENKSDSQAYTSGGKSYRSIGYIETGKRGYFEWNNYLHLLVNSSAVSDAIQPDSVIVFQNSTNKITQNLVRIELKIDIQFREYNGLWGVKVLDKVSLILGEGISPDVLFSFVSI